MRSKVWTTELIGWKMRRKLFSPKPRYKNWKILFFYFFNSFTPFQELVMNALTGL
jgi:hypothetical protein